MQLPCRHMGEGGEGWIIVVFASGSNHTCFLCNNYLYYTTSDGVDLPSAVLNTRYQYSFVTKLSF